MENKLNNNMETEEVGMSEEVSVRYALREKRKKIKSMKDLIKFLKMVEKDYDYGYGVAPVAIAQASLAVSWYLSKKFGITGFQASCTMWDFIKDWMFTSNRCGLKIVDYDEMLFPQYEHKFEKTINEDTWERLQKEAKYLLEHEVDEFTSDHVIEHWKSIVNGEIPFGYKVKED